MTTQVKLETNEIPQRESGFKRFFKALILMRESPIGMVGLVLILFWVVMAVIAPLLPLYDPNAIMGSGSDLNFCMNINPEFHLVDEQSNHRVMHQFAL